MPFSKGTATRWLLSLLVVGILITLGCNSRPAPDSYAGINWAAHCLDGDGNHPEMIEKLRDRLKDPESLRVDQTVVLRVQEDGRHLVTMYYGARNGFGAYVRDVQYGWIDHDTCEAVLN